MATKRTESGNGARAAHAAAGAAEVAVDPAQAIVDSINEAVDALKGEGHDGSSVMSPLVLERFNQSLPLIDLIMRVVQDDLERKQAAVKSARAALLQMSRVARPGETRTQAAMRAADEALDGAEDGQQAG